MGSFPAARGDFPVRGTDGTRRTLHGGSQIDRVPLKCSATGQGTEILSQDNWGENPDATFTAQTAQAVSAFALNAGSAAAAFVVTLPPGLYTVIGASADGTSTGVVLVEVYVEE